MTDQAPLTPEKPFVVTRNHELIELVDQCTGKAAVALDAEANGLHAFRARLCVLQIAWRDGDNVVMAVIDTLELNLSPLAKLLSNAGPVKIVHDLTFDARILQERGITLGRVRVHASHATYASILRRRTARAAFVCGRARAKWKARQFHLDSVHKHQLFIKYILIYLNKQYSNDKSHLS